MSVDLPRRREFMAGAGALAAAAAARLAGVAEADSPAAGLEYVGTGEIQCTPPIPVGATPYGSRVVIPIVGGTFTGRLAGQVVPGGADYNLTLADGSHQFDARYLLRTDDGALVVINDVGLANPTAAGGHTILFPTFEVGDPRYEWLADNLFVVDLTAAGDAEGILVHIDIYMIVPPTRARDRRFEARR